jgi:hypothetical protein
VIKEEHDKLDSNNKSLQKYIDMSTQTITVTGSALQPIASSGRHKEDGAFGDISLPEHYELSGLTETLEELSNDTPDLPATVAANVVCG